MQKEFKYILKEPIVIAKEGKQVEAKSLIIKSPRPCDANNALRLESIFKQSFLRFASALGDLAKNANQEDAAEKEQDKIDSVLTVLLSGANDTSLGKSLCMIEDLVCDGNLEHPQGTIDGVKFTKPIFSKIGLIDQKNILGGYIYSFLSLT